MFIANIAHPKQNYGKIQLLLLYRENGAPKENETLLWLNII